MYIPKLNYSQNNCNILRHQFDFEYTNKNYRYNKNIHKLNNNLYYLWKNYKLKKYINYLQQYIYSNPRLPYMKYYIENQIDDENKKLVKFKIGYINSKNQLIWYGLK